MLILHFYDSLLEFCRKMFPAIAVSVFGLNQDESYSMKLVLLPADEHCFRFQILSGCLSSGVRS